MPAAANKIRVLAVSDWADTGFGRVMRELLPRLVATGLFEVEMVGWVYNADPDVYDEARRLGVRLHPALGGGLDWGKATTERVCQKFKPQVLLTLGDPWMVAWADTLRYRDKLRWVAYVPIDREPIPHAWTVDLKKPDVLVLYSEFGRKAVDAQMPFRRPEVILHGVDCKVFRPLPESQVRAATNGMKDGDKFIVGSVCRNQERKNVPALFRSFKAFNCLCLVEPDRRRDGLGPIDVYSCPRCGSFEQDPEKVGSLLYLHMTMGDGSDPRDKRGVAWNIHELVTRFKLKGRVLSTPNYSVSRGVPSEHLNVIYNLFDVHLITTKREGFCLPVLEAMAAGTPNVVTGYSACAELVERGGGVQVPVESWVCDPHDEADGGIIDCGKAADAIDLYFRSPETRLEHAASGRRFAESLAWDNLIDPWRNLLEKLAVHSVETEPAAEGAEA